MAPVKTINADCILPRLLTSLLAAAILAGCEVNANAPPCPFQHLGDRASSAGCFAMIDDRLLVVVNRRGQLSPPGGSSESGESAQCTAFRETWEETGLLLEPSELLQVFDTGFHLYRCEHRPYSGEIRPPSRFEKHSAFYVAEDEFDDHEWRFPGQEVHLRALSERMKLQVDKAPVDQ
jgi:8-oxo-dGTP pyrophosphatase MutT (NUDIX family)